MLIFRCFQLPTVKQDWDMKEFKDLVAFWPGNSIPKIPNIPLAGIPRTAKFKKLIKIIN